MTSRQTQMQQVNRAVSTGMAEIEEAIKNIPGLEQAGTKLSRSIHSAVLEGGDMTRAIADALHGTWFGHPLHPALTDVPVGSWLLASMFDLYASLGGGHEAERTADRLITIGVVASIPTALAGLADYSAIKKDAVAVGAAHALLNTAGLGLYLLSLWDRASGRRQRGVLFSTLALTLTGVSAGLGGDLIYRLRVGVNHAPAATQPEEWTPVLKEEELPRYEPKRIELDGEAVLLYRDDDAIHAIAAICSHAGGPLDEGSFDGHCVMCPWHQSVFDLRDGGVVHGPAIASQPLYEARIRNGQVELRMKRSETASESGGEERPAPEHSREVGGSA